MFYRIPENLASELAELDDYIARYERGDLDATALKVRRVPFGCYEQRRDGTYMVRVRTTGGAHTPRQLQVMGELGAQYGADAIHITTRQEFQIHDIALGNITRVMRELLKVGLATRGGGGNTIRNVLVSPDAGVRLDEVFDPSPYAFALTTRLIAEPDSWVLPRKFKIAFSNSPADSSYSQFNDIGFIAKIRDGVKGFKVHVAGGLGTKPQTAHLLHEFIPADDVYLVTTALKRLFDQNGNRKNRHAARLRFLWHTLGEARFRALYEEQARQIRAENPAPLAIEEVPQTVTLPPFAPETDNSPEFELWKLRYVEPQRQAGLVSVVVPVFLGNLKNKDAIRLARFLAPFGDFVSRATFGQNLRLRNIPESYLANVYHLASEITELAAQPRLLGNSISCTGADTCKLGICLPKGALTAVAATLRESDLDLDRIPDFRLNLSGCPNTCGQHMIADLGFFGNVGRKEQQMFPAYAVVAGSRLEDGEARLAKQIDRVNARDLPAYVRDVLKLWLEKKSAYDSFACYIDAEGAQDLKRLADKYRSIPDVEVARDYYVDWGTENLFSLVGKSAGECSAGLFDLIEVDLKQAKHLREEVRSGDSANHQALYAIALCSARALLITRGIESANDAAVFESFHKHFIHAKMIESGFEPVIAAAQRLDFAALAELRETVFGLLDAVDALYKSMDDSLRFAAEQAKAVLV